MVNWMWSIGVAILILGTGFSSVFALGSLDRVIISDERLVNAFGEKLSGSININQQVQIATDITNGQTDDQPFVYILQIKNSDGHIISVSTIAGELQQAQSFSAALSWNPDQSGIYVAEIYVWESLVNADALAKSKTLQIIVG